MTVAAKPQPVRAGAFNPPVFRAGSGEPLVFFHAAGGMPAGLPPDMQKLSERFEVIAPVHPGWDDTDGLDGIDDIHDLMLYYQDFIDDAGIPTPFNLVGHSIGGMFAAEFAAARPDLVKKLVLIAPVGLWNDAEPVTDIFSLLPNELPQYLFADPESPTVKAMFPQTDDLDVIADRMYMQLSNMAAAGKFIWPIPDKGLKKRAHRIKAPTLILWGNQDRLAPVSYAQLFADTLPNATVRTIDGAGHMLPVEQTAQEVQAIEEFLA